MPEYEYGEKTSCMHVYVILYYIKENLQHLPHLVIELQFYRWCMTDSGITYKGCVSEDLEFFSESNNTRWANKSQNLGHYVGLHVEYREE